jgi:SAM-dependent methyltransferase
MEHMPQRSMQRRTACRLCNSNRLAIALPLEATPPANAFVTADALAVAQETFPLDVYFCENCTHLQLLDIVDPEILFANYVYVSGTSPSFIRHFEHYSDQIAQAFGPLSNRLVVDIGSNDGTLLRAFKERHGARTLGVDPARNLAAVATSSGINTIGEFFTPALAIRIAVEHGDAQIVTANNVFAHIDDLADVAEGVRTLLADDGLFVFGVSYLLDVVVKTLFDTIYHEHLSYHAVRPLVGFFERHGLELIEVQRVQTHGGSLRGVAQRKGGARQRGASIEAALSNEESHGLEKLETFHAMAANIKRLGNELTAILTQIRLDKKSIAGFGAPAKATTLMHQFRLDSDTIKFIVDDSPLKQGLFTPGLHIPVLAPEALEQRNPDYLLLLAWNFADAIIEKSRSYLDRGGRFIIPVPKVEVISR